MSSYRYQLVSSFIVYAVGGVGMYRADPAPLCQPAVSRYAFGRVLHDDRLGYIFIGQLVYAL